MVWILESCQEHHITDASDLILRTFDRFLAEGAPEIARTSLAEILNPESIRKMASEAALIDVATDEGRVVAVQIILPPRYLKALFVDGDYHGQGIARALWNKGARQALELYPGDEPFYVNASDYALEVYRRMGFEAIDERQEKQGLTFTPMQAPPRL